MELALKSTWDRKKGPKEREGRIQKDLDEVAGTRSYLDGGQDF